VTYLTQGEIAENRYMNVRVAQCVATQDVNIDPDRWTTENRREWAATPGWDASWAAGYVANPDDPAYDPGADEACITDQAILSAVQLLLAPPA
jgi:hypothetical protein